MKEQLEIYKIVLRGTPGDNFGKLITDKYGKAKSKRIEDVFLKIFRTLIENIDMKVWKSTSSLPALTILKRQKKQDVKQIISPNSETFVIEGYIDGGHYDMMRQLTEMSDTSKTTAITKDKMVSDRYYVYLHINPTQNLGILMVERKGQLSISSSFVKFLEQYFKVANNRKCKIVRYIPKYLIDEFKQGAIVESITCSDQFVKQILDADNVVIRDAHYDVTIKITPKDDDDRKSDKTHLLSQIQSMAFSIMGIQRNNRSIANFSNKKGHLKQPDGKSLPFELDDEDAIRPIIAIPDDYISENHDTLHHDLIKPFCNDVLNKIRNEIYAVE